MCGRFTLAISAKALSSYVMDKYQIYDMNMDDFKPQFNVAPSSQIISIIHDTKKYRIGTLKWGFVPSFAKDEKSFQMINAKAETLFEKSSFKQAALKQRCVVLADSFYEWDKQDKHLPPRRILTTDQKVFAMAGIWNTFEKSNGEKVHTVAIVTTKANQMMQTIHDRMPVILTKKAEEIWLNPHVTDEMQLKNILVPYDQDKMKMYKVSKKINKPSFDQEEALIELKEEHTLF